MKAKIAKRLLKTLKRVDRPTSFCVHESAPVTLPGLEVKGMGPIGLPISEAQARELVGAAHQAPYGKGEETVVDTNVRCVWAIDPDKFSLTNPQWPTFINERVSHFQEELGLEDQQLTTHLYQLLLYEPGGFFLAHKDGEKRQGMVATLVIVLPSIYEGGELIVRHCGHEKIIDFSGPDSAFYVHAAAFYADCEHEIKPIQKGFRLALVYNITLSGSKKAIRAPQYGTQTEQITKLLEAWKKQSDPEKIAVLLGHEYTEKGLTPYLLKGTDRARAEALFAAGAKAGCRGYLGLLILYESGAAEGDYGYGYDDDPEDYTMGEIFDRSLTVKKWVDKDGNSVNFGEIGFDEEEEIISDFALTDVDPDEEFEGYTGNAGMELQRWYRHAAIVLWPEARNFEILCRAGVQSALMGLKQMISEWKENKADDGLKKQCIQFAKTILKQWPQQQNYFSYNEDKRKTDMVALLRTLGDPALIASYIGEVLVKDASEFPRGSLANLCKPHGWSRFQNPITTLMESTDRETVARNVSFFESLCTCKGNEKDRINLCKELATPVFQILKQTEFAWQRGNFDRKQLIISLFKAFYAVQEYDLLEALVKDLTTLSDKYDLTLVQIPAVIDLATWLKNKSKLWPKAYNQWLQICQEKLVSRTENEPQPPSDWRRPATFSCSCSDCSELRYFLSNPNESAHRFRVREDRRNHLQGIIASNQCDLTHKTERSGSPYSLVCEKTNAAYERRLKTYQIDCQNLSKIEAIQAAIK